MKIGKKINKTIPKNERFLHINFDFFYFHFRAAENLLKMRFVKLVEQILIVK